MSGAAVLAVGIPTGWRDGALDTTRARGIVGYEVEGDIPAEFIEAAHEAGLTVYAYVVNVGAQMRRPIERGVDGIASDVPELLSTVAREARFGSVTGH